jgi:hypothetical protein
MTVSHFSTCANASWSAGPLRRGSAFGGAVTVFDMIASLPCGKTFVADEAADCSPIL